MPAFIWNESQAEQIRSQTEATMNAQLTEMREAIERLEDAANTLEAEADALEDAPDIMKEIQVQSTRQNSDGKQEVYTTTQWVVDQAAMAQRREQIRAMRDQVKELRQSATAMSDAADELEQAIANSNALFERFFELSRRTDSLAAVQMLRIQSNIRAYTARMQGIRDSFDIMFSSMTNEMAAFGRNMDNPALANTFITLPPHLSHMTVPPHPSDARPISSIFSISNAISTVQNALGFRQSPVLNMIANMGSVANRTAQGWPLGVGGSSLPGVAINHALMNVITGDGSMRTPSPSNPVSIVGGNGNIVSHQNWIGLSMTYVRSDGSIGTTAPITGTILDVPAFSQFDTPVIRLGNPNEPHLLCWATTAAMVDAFLREDMVDRTGEIARSIQRLPANATVINRANSWPDAIFLGRDVGFVGQSSGILTMDQIRERINPADGSPGLPFAVLHNQPGSGPVIGHWTLGIGYIYVPGSGLKVVYVDPAGGNILTRTYEDFLSKPVSGGPNRDWSMTVQ